jgi:P27 family predicted phage terminase small subunit
VFCHRRSKSCFHSGRSLMPSGGHNRKPALAVIREGNPGKRPVMDSAKLPPSALIEPRWSSVFLGTSAESKRARLVASRLWKKIAPTLSRSVGLVGEQQEVLVDYCVTVARIDQGERAVSREGVIVAGAMGGTVKNPWTTVLNQYRSNLRSLVGELGLSPSSATRITRPESSSEDDPFDD